ncbi:MAG: hypothetical protein VX584_01975 [Actinomycetota bacterium]|nr:hypothetical protein [Actinomycetota bacterium]
MSKPEEEASRNKIRKILNKWVDSEVLAEKALTDVLGEGGATEPPRPILGMKKRIPLSPEEVEIYGHSFEDEL